MVGTPILSEGDGAASTLSENDVQEIKHQVYEVLADTFRAALETSVHFQVLCLSLVFLGSLIVSLPYLNDFFYLSQALPNAFELFGADLLVSHIPSSSQSGSQLPSQFSVTILELNAEPAIELTGARLSWILENMFSGICDACVRPFFGNKGGEEEKEVWKVETEKHGLYKALDVQVRGTKGW